MLETRLKSWGTSIYVRRKKNKTLFLKIQIREAELDGSSGLRTCQVICGTVLAWVLLKADPKFWLQVAYVGR